MISSKGTVRPARPAPLASSQLMVRATPHKSSNRWRLAALFALYFLLAVLLQWKAGCFHAEFDGYPDEPAHYITGLMVHDYLLSGSLLHPMSYAENYYLHYPKVAFGHWPPLFYLIQAAWMLLFTTSRISILLLMAAITACVALVTESLGRRRIGAAGAAGAGALFILLPVVQENTGMVMAESLLALFALLAAASFGRFLDTGSARHAVWFGVWTVLTILSKGNGWALVLMAPLALVAGGRLRLLLRPAFWLGAGVVALALPWQLYTLHMARQGWDGKAGLPYVADALPSYLGLIVRDLGWALAALALAGLAACCLLPLLRRQPVDGFWAAMTALALAAWWFHSLVPAGIEDRKLIIGLPALLLLAGAGAGALAGPLRRLGRWSLPAIQAAALAAFTVQVFAVPVKPVNHFAEAAEAALRAMPSDRDVFFVSGSAAAEGSFIAEVAMREARPGHFVLRASKMFADTDWGARSPVLRYSNTAAAEAKLESWGVRGLAAEQAPVSGDPYHAFLLRLLNDYRLLWKPETLPADCAGQVSLFRFDGPPNPRPEHFEIDLKPMLGRSLTAE